MTTALTNTGDGFDGYNIDVAGKENKPSGIFRGERLKFGKTGEWENPAGEVIDEGVKLIFLDITRLVVRWGKEKGPPLETVVLAPGEKVPDIEAWNDQIPKDEWLIDMNGRPRGPWQFQQVCHFLDPKSMSQFHWVDSTVGGSICIRECIDSVKAMRRFRPGAAPVVELGSKFMDTRFGGRQRPHLQISSWVNLPGTGAEPQQAAALPAPAATAATVIEAKPVKDKPKPSMITTLDVAAPLEAVKPPTIGEEMNDEIGF
jgi:hypothetical protein